MTIQWRVKANSSECVQHSHIAKMDYYEFLDKHTIAVTAAVLKMYRENNISK